MQPLASLGLVEILFGLDSGPSKYSGLNHLGLTQFENKHLS